MKLVVFGASGRTGRIVVERALEYGYRATAIVRDPDSFPVADAGLTVEKGDVLDPSTFGAALGQADAVVSALGLNSRHDTTPVCTLGTKNILEAMLAEGVKRLVVTSAAPVLSTGAGDPIFFRVAVRPVLRSLLRNNYADMGGMESALLSSDVDWTILKPGYLKSGRSSGGFRRAFDRNVAGSMWREDLAEAMLSVLGDRSTYRRALGIAS